MNIKKYLFFASILFIIEYVTSILYPPATYLLLSLVVYSMIMYGVEKWIIPNAIAIIFFDIFSGLSLGVFTLSMLTVILSIYVINKFLVIQNHSTIFLVIATLLSRILFSYTIKLISNISLNISMSIESFSMSLIFVLIIFLIDKQIFYKRQFYGQGEI